MMSRDAAPDATPFRKCTLTPNRLSTACHAHRECRGISSPSKKRECEQRASVYSTDHGNVCDIEPTYMDALCDRLITTNARPWHID